MLHYVQGTIAELHDDFLVLDVGGVGLRVHVSRATREALFRARGGSTEGSQGDHDARVVRLYTHLHAREGELALYGFHTVEERRLFELLLGVSGVGPRVAIAILSATTPQRLQEALVRGRVEELAAIKGIGRKTAERLVVELKEKVAQLPLGPEAEGAPTPAGALRPQDEVALQALVRTLGFREAEARRAVERAKARYGELPTEELIKRALEFLSKP